MTNHAKQVSINTGTEIKVGNTTYFGKLPEYQKFGEFGYFKVSKGIPFVNMDKMKL